MEISKELLMTTGAIVLIVILIFILILRQLLRKISGLTEQYLYCRRTGDKQDKLVRLLEEVLSEKIEKPKE